MSVEPRPYRAASESIASVSTVNSVKIAERANSMASRAANLNGSGARSWRWPWNVLLPLIAAMLTAGLYSWASRNNGFIYDDHEVIENQYPANSLAAVRQIFSEPHYINFPYYRPVTRTALAIQKAIAGNQPLTFHVANALLAGAVLLAAYGILRRPVFAIDARPALLAAMWFVLHPVASECVFPAASGRETIQPTLLMLVALWAYLHRGIGWYWAAFGAFAVALFSKELAIVLPAVFLLADWLNLSGRPRGAWRWALRYVPIALFVGFYLVVRHGVLAHRAAGAGFQLDWQHHPLSPVLAMAYAVQTAVAPFAQLVYEPTGEVWWSPGRLAFGVVILAAIATAAWKCAGETAAIERRADTPGAPSAAARSAEVRLAGAPSEGAGPASAGSARPRSGLVFWAGWFVIVQLPTARILVQEAPFSERYVFPALLSIAAAGAVALSGRALRPRARFFATFAGIIWVVLLAHMSCGRAPFYANDRIFSEQWARTNPDSSNAHNGLALVASERGDLSAALAEYRAALRLDPQSSTALNNSANLLVELARQRRAGGDEANADLAIDEAAADYQRLLVIDPRDASALCNFGDMLGEFGYVSRAIEKYHQAIAAKPGYAQAHYHLAIALDLTGSAVQAKDEFETALRLRPDWPEAMHDYVQRLIGDADITFRDPDRAVEIAARLAAIEEQAQDADRSSGPGSRQPRWEYLNDLVLAYRAAGRDADASSSAAAFAGRAESAGDAEAASLFRREVQAAVQS
jgi:tetratricopeptide (TPR) repeat protein